MSGSIVFSGARGRLRIGNELIGYATNCNGGESIEFNELEVMDNIRVQEHVPVRYRCRFSASIVRLVGKGPKARLLFPKSGNSPSEHLKNILAQEDLTITIEDTPTGKLIVTLLECRASTNNWQVAAGSISATDVEFVCIVSLEEGEG